MQASMSIIAIASALGVGAISPGPSFLLVARNAIGISRRHGFATALGMGSGSLIFSIIALLGLHAVFTAVPLAFVAFKMGGGLYLLYLAARIVLNARHAMPHHNQQGSQQVTLRRVYSVALLTQLSNPKTAIIFAGVFSALLPEHYPNYFFLIIPLVAFCIDVIWFVCVSYLLSASSPRRIYLKCKTVIDMVAGSVMAVLGLKLIFNSSK
jgi:threonine/homoserine/homoserine lactone efflux protein